MEESIKDSQASRTDDSGDEDELLKKALEESAKLANALMSAEEDE